MMKTLAIIILLCGLLNGQTGNITKTSSSQIPVIHCKKIAIAHNDDGPYPFKLPHDFLFLDSGGFLVVEGSTALEFDNHGKFLKTFIRKGQGPGEAVFLYQLYNRSSEIIANCDFGSKLMFFDQNGNLKAEHRISIKPNLTKQHIQLARTNSLILAHSLETGDFLVLDGNGQLRKNSKKDCIKDFSVMKVSSTNQWEQKMTDFSLKCARVGNKKRQRCLLSSFFISTSDGEFIYLLNTERYEIKQYNIKKNVVERIWKKDFKPVKIPIELSDAFSYGETYISYDAKKGKQVVITPPQLEHFIDVQGIFVHEDKVWVVTSDVKPGRGILTDIYNKSGKHIDSFYLGLPLTLNESLLLFQKEVCIHKDTLIMREKDLEDNYVVSMYKMYKANETK